MLVAFNPSASQATNLLQLKKIFDENATIHKSLDDFSQNVSKSVANDFDFNRDVASWIGTEIAIAVFDSPGGLVIGGSEQPWVVLMAEIRDPGQLNIALARLHSIAEQQGTEFVDQNYRGVAMTLIKPKYSSGQCCVSYASYDGEMLFSLTTDALQEAIDTKQGSGSDMRSNAEYKTVMDKLPQNRTATLFVAANKLIDQLSTYNQPGLQALQGARSLGVSISFVEAGVQIDYVTTMQQSGITSARRKYVASQKANSSRTIGRLPSDTLFVVNGQDLKSIWTYAYDELMQDVPGTAQIPQQLNQFEQQTGINVENDLIDWMTGEYALAVVPARPNSLMTGMSAGLLLMFDVKDNPQAAQDGVNKITRFLRQQNLLFKTRNMNGNEAEVLAGNEEQGVTPGYAFSGDYLVIASAEDVLSAALAPDQTLNNDSNFTTVTQSLPRPNTGIVYLNISSAVDTYQRYIRSFGGTSGGDEVTSIIEPFKSISFAYSVPESDGTQTGAIFITVSR
jgi:hypothetical protein